MSEPWGTCDGACPKCGSVDIVSRDDASWPTCNDCGFVQYDAESLALQAEVKAEQAQAKREFGYIPTYREWVERER